MAEGDTRVGVIGAGRMGERHSRVYSGIRNVDFVGVADPCPERGRQVASTYSTRFFEDYRELLPLVDAVSIATPTNLHFAIAKDCIQRRANVLIEKPLSDSVTQARELVEMAAEHRVVLQVGHLERFNPAFLELQSIADDLQIVALDARRLSPFDTSNTEVDVVFDLMIHDIDLALALLGPDIDGIQMNGRSARTVDTDYAVATLSFANGGIATLTASRVTEQKVRLIEVTALGAYVEADLLNKTVSIHRRMLPEYLTNHERPLRYRQESLVERIHIPTAEPLMLELQDFVRCVREGYRPRVAGAEGLRALELATRIRAEIGVTAPRSGGLLVA